MSQQLSDTEQWLSLTQAAKQLGIHSTTLRRWADNGDIPFMLTPGGHRRFSSADLQQFSQHHRKHKMQSTVGVALVQKALTQTRQVIGANQDQKWLSLQDEDSREQHRILGRRLMGMTLQFISDEGNGSILEEAELLGVEYGRLSLASKLPLTEALKATIFFRDMLVETALQMPESTRIKPEANVRLMRRINELINTVHLAIAAAYEKEQS
ncbi:MAG: excisionase family DNA-binding protein [Chloroflexi bacterium]|nr:excisionase family DNA-binding protein [Chloroflexota bacterium]